MSFTEITDEVNYTSDSQLRNPKLFLRKLLGDIKITKELSGRFFKNSFRSQYRQSWLGYLWLFLPPLSTALIWIFLGYSEILNTNGIDGSYPVYVLTGIFIWQTFVESLYCPLQQLSANRNLLVKVKVPHEVYIVAGLGTLLFNLMIRFVFLFGVLLLFGIPLKLTLLLAPLMILPLIVLGLCFGFWLTPIGILYKDIFSGLNILISIWFFATPIIYYLPAASLHTSLFRLNPVIPLLNATRDLIISGKVSIDSDFLLITALSLSGLFLSWMFYRLSQPHLVTRITG